MPDDEAQVTQDIAEMIDIEGADPKTLHDQVDSCLKMLDRNALIHFDCGHLGLGSSLAFEGSSEEVPPALEAAVMKLLPALLACEIEDFDPHRQITGRVRMDHEGVWLDAEDIDDDWDYQRSIDTDSLEFATFEEPVEDTDPLLVPDA